MNIGIVTAWQERGAAYVSKAYIDVLSPQHNIFVYARGGEFYAKDDENWNRNYVTWGKRVHFGIPMFIVWPDFKRWIVDNHIETIIFNEQQSWDAVLRVIKLDLKIGTYVDYYTEKTIPFFWLYDFLLCNTKRHYSVFKDHPQSIFIPWGTDCETFNGDCLPIWKEGLVYFHSAGMNPYRKGTDILVRAFQEVKGNVRLIIHSQVAIKDKATSGLIKQDPRITLIVKTVASPGLYNQGDVYVYPTRLEGIGLTIAEALASGLPVITVDNAPMNEFVKDGINGHLIPVIQHRKRKDNYYWEECLCDEKRLTEAMQFYVSHRSALNEYKVAARNYALKNLDWRKNTEFLPKYIREIKRLNKETNLVKAATFYEYSRIPSLVSSALIRKLKTKIR